VKKPVTIIILGPVGSGKGTQANFLARKFGWEHISTGALLRNRIRIKDELGQELALIMKKGKLVPSWVVFTLTITHVSQYRWKGVVIDGSPRTLSESNMLDEALARLGRNNLIVLYLHISPKETMGRLLKRARSDDSAKSIKVRINVFKNQVMPVINHYRRKALVLEVDGEQSREKVFEEIINKLKESGVT